MSASPLLSINIALGSLVVAVGGWLAWNALSMSGATAVLVVAAAFLWWRGQSLTHVWAWSTLLLGAECFAWPIGIMLRIRFAGGEPSEEDMATMLSAILMGLFSAVFWIAFSYGLFKRAQARAAPPGPSGAPRQP